MTRLSKIVLIHFRLLHKIVGVRYKFICNPKKFCFERHSEVQLYK